MHLVYLILIFNCLLAFCHVLVNEYMIWYEMPYAVLMSQRYKYRYTSISNLPIILIWPRAGSGAVSK